jgi:hypothetical protein
VRASASGIEGGIFQVRSRVPISSGGLAVIQQQERRSSPAKNQDLLLTPRLDQMHQDPDGQPLQALDIMGMNCFLMQLIPASICCLRRACCCSRCLPSNGKGIITDLMSEHGGGTTETFSP